MSLLFILEFVLWFGLGYFGVLAIAVTALQIHGSFFATHWLTILEAALGYKWKRQWFYLACVFIPLALIKGWLVWDLF